MHKFKNEGDEYNFNWKVLEKVNKHKQGKTTHKLYLKEALKILQAISNCINKNLNLCVVPDTGTNFC